MNKGIEEQVLSIDQMRELKELGIDTSDASMYYRPNPMYDIDTDEVDFNIWENPKWVCETSPIYFTTEEGKEAIFAYTLFDLINKLPSMITIDGINYFIHYNKYGVWYRDVNKKVYPIENETRGILKSSFDMLKWIIQEYLK